MKTRSAPFRLGGAGVLILAALGIHFGLWLIARQASVAMGPCAGCTYVEWWQYTFEAVAAVWNDLW